MPGTAVRTARRVGRAWTWARWLLALAVAASVGALAATPAQAETFTVINANASGPRSLDQAITKANNNDNAPTIDTVKFNVPSGDANCDGTTNVCTIAATSGMPRITEPLTINGYSQLGAKPNTQVVGNNAVLRIELNGAGSGQATGLWIGAKNSTVTGLVINRWHEGVRISAPGARGNKVAGNFIGTDALGAADRGNLFGVVIDDVPNNTVGGDAPAKRNVISANDESELAIFGAAATGNKVVGNYVDTDAQGAARLGNRSGVSIAGARNTTVGGTTAGTHNVISANKHGGVAISACAQGNRVTGNYVGTDATGFVDVGNLISVKIEGASNNTVGGDAPAKRNVISANDESGVAIFGAGATGNKVVGNYVGTDAQGAARLGNRSGVSIDGARNTTVGGTTAGARNVISGNGWSGVAIGGPQSNSSARANTVMGNYIGTRADGTVAVWTPNFRSGVFESNADDNTIGARRPGRATSSPATRPTASSLAGCATTPMGAAATRSRATRSETTPGTVCLSRETTSPSGARPSERATRSSATRGTEYSSLKARATASSRTRSTPTPNSG